MTQEEIYQRYLFASAITRNADALAGLFAVDGVLESPLIPPGHHYPRRLEGREEIRAGMAAFYERRPPDPEQTPDPARSGFKVHTTADPAVFIVEIDVVLSSPAGTENVSLVQIFRVRDGEIVLMRDYFAPAIVD